MTEADRRTARLQNQFSIGLFYEGFDGLAPDDVLGASVGRTHVNGWIEMVEQLSHRAGEGNEYAGEIFYSIHPIAGVVVRPNFQYVVHPGGRSDRGDVVVLGLKTALNL